MGLIPNIEGVNRHRQEMMKIKTANDEVILFTKEEAKRALMNYINEELDLFSDELGEVTKKEIQGRLTLKLKSIEDSMLKHIDDKIDKITERVFEQIINRKINEEVNIRLEAKLKKIKDSL